jgi:predicted extracellular nuclease
MKLRTRLVVGLAVTGALGCADTSSSKNAGTDGTTDGTVDGTTDSTDGADGTTDSTDGATDGNDSADGGTDGADGGTGTTQTIEALQTSTGSTSCDPSKITNIMSDIAVKGAVVTGGRFIAFEPEDGSDAEPLDGYFISDVAGGANKGIQITVPAKLGLALLPGDAVDVYGEYLEFYCSSQIKASRVDPVGTAAVPAPTIITGADLTDLAKAETLEGTLVKLENVKVESLDQFDFIVTGGARVSGGLYRPGYFAAPGDELTSITGVVDFSYGNYKIQPRSKDDIVIGKVAPSTDISIADIQSGDASAKCTNPSGNAAATQKKIRVTGVVVSPVYQVSANLNGIYISTETPGPNSGLPIIFGKDDGFTANVGDTVAVEGDVKEFYCNTQVQATALAVMGTGAAPAPAEVTVADLTGANAESYEGSYVTVSGLVVSDIADMEKFNQITVEGGLILAGDDFGVTWNVAVGDAIAKATGAIEYAFEAYRLLPFGPDAVE